MWKEVIISDPLFVFY